jgi:hypothetical protein
VSRVSQTWVTAILSELDDDDRKGAQ